MTLDRRAFSYFDEARNAWVTPGGRVPIYVGRSSRDIELTGSVAVPAAQEIVLPLGQITGIGSKCVDVAGGATANGAAVQLYGCNGTGAQDGGRGPTGAAQPQSGRCRRKLRQRHATDRLRLPRRRQSGLATVLT